MSINVQMQETYSRTSHTAIEITKTLQVAQSSYSRFIAASQALKLALEPYYEVLPNGIKRFRNRPTAEVQTLLELRELLLDADLEINTNEIGEQYPVKDWKRTIRTWDKVSQQIENRLQGGT